MIRSLTVFWENESFNLIYPFLSCKAEVVCGIVCCVESNISCIVHDHAINTFESGAVTFGVFMLLSALSACHFICAINGDVSILCTFFALKNFYVLIQSAFA